MSDHYEIAQVDDSFAWLRGCDEGQVDVVLTDPPYSEHVHANMSGGTAMKHHVESGGRGGIPRVELPFEALAGYEFAADLIRVARRWAISFCAVEDFGAYRATVTDAWVRGGIWYKPNSMGQLTGDRPAAAYEGLAIMHRKVRKHWNGRGSFAYWAADSDEFPSEEAHFVCNGTRGEAGRHPNQKPLALCLELVAKFTNRGDLVLDPFCGSGRIGEACMALGRRYVGLERDAAWVDAARARLEAALAEVGFGGVSDEACLRLCAAPKLSHAAGSRSPARPSRGRSGRARLQSSEPGDSSPPGVARDSAPADA